MLVGAIRSSGGYRVLEKGYQGLVADSDKLERNPGVNTGRFKKGPDPRRGVGKKGCGGPRPRRFKELCRDILESDDTLEAMRAAAKTPNFPGFTALLKMLASYSEGLPKQEVEHSGGVSIYLGEELLGADQDV